MKDAFVPRYLVIRGAIKNNFLSVYININDCRIILPQYQLNNNYLTSYQ